MKINNHQQGVIMLEALIGLIICALVGMALMNINSQALQQQQHLGNTQCAIWLAQNLLTMEMLVPPGPELRDEQGTAMQCDKRWQWKFIRRTVNDSRFYQVTLEIRDEQERLQLSKIVFRAR